MIERPHLPTSDRLRIDSLYKNNKHVYDQGLTGAIFIAEDEVRKIENKPSISSDKERGKFVSWYMDMVQHGIEHGVSAPLMGLWTHGILDVLNNIINPKPILSIFDKRQQELKVLRWKK